MSEESPSQVDVLVVGGGPVGLFAANMAVRSGLTMRIVDIESEPQHWGRGDWLHGRTLEILDYTGLNTDLLGTGSKVETLAVHHQLPPRNHTATAGRTSMDFVPESIVTKYKHLLCVGQHITESNFQHTLSENGIQVERPVTVTQFTQKEGEEYPILATLENKKNHATEVIRAKYLLGCDGAHSSIRQQLGIGYEGNGSKRNCGVLDALVQTNFPDRKSISFVRGPFGSHACLFPRENNLTRVMVELPSDDRDRNQIPLETVQSEARRALLPHRVEFLAVMWWTVYSVGQHVAARYTDNAGDTPRVFLCGDACHSQSPTLGQGLNTGIGDVFNLVWKIAMVNAGLAKPVLLSTYEPERRPIAQKVIAIDRLVSENVSKDEPLMSLIRENQELTTGFGVSYATGTPRSSAGFLRAGDRAPDFKVVAYSTSKKARLYDLWRTKDSWCFHLLILAGDLCQTAARVAEALEAFKDKDWSWLQIHLITTTTQKGVIDATPSVISKQALLIDKINQAQCHHGYGVKDEDAPVAVVIRPDLHIGWIGTLSSSMEEWLATSINLGLKGWNV
ncbi:FAD binding domain-containing protein [Zychaea mexicana]|uniref:FAD binding domain-containing protein n=1 Tax=Zychaea mexicana TaxID=64656 RepID=UPI0022FDCCB8|nr:FAD binding domain-containing protein [Zychaea mexicana]KAI9477701.1 FAD binding domain-containing protein [Zychaea mexicana]